MNRLTRKITICLVEDEQSLIEMIQFNLELDGYDIFAIRDGGLAKEHFELKIDYDLFILDVMLPRISGLDLCKIIREKSQAPILFLSAKGTTQDRIEGLKIGANDYLPKPFDLEELILKVKILTKKEGEQKDFLLQVGELVVDFNTFEVRTPEDKIVHLFSKREIGLLKLFHEKEGKVVSRDEILDRVWGKDSYPTARTIDNYILVFRKIFEKNARKPQFFHSIRSVGYKFTK
ncbi:MAG: response regulator transcription factor [Flavobacteriia bacterium]|nr:response regulator transcription factor [Flavobacteriia bacterium]